MLCPWEIAPELTEERLRLIACTVDRVRNGVLEAHEPDKGDGSWGFGCRAYERTCFALSKLADAEENRGWFKVEADRLECTLRVGGVPIKFYRGDPTDPNPRALRGGLIASLRDLLGGQQTLFPPDARERAASGWFWLMAIETHGDGTVSRVLVLQARESGEVQNEWEIPLELPVPAIAPVATMRREGVDLPPPKVGPKAPAVPLETNDELGTASSDVDRKV